VGRVITTSKVFTRENLEAEVPMLTGAYAYQTLGDFPAYLALIALAYALYRARRAA
jgi:apolipoprotein N-acyltransferase